MSLADMPTDFLWGAATASFQIEGATREDGRGESIWDRFCATPGKVKDGDTGDPACDHYHRYPQDVALMKDLGLQAYRFSIAWPRVFPEGVGAVSEKGLDFYERLVDALLEAGIRPFATLYHWDLPQALQERWGGWIGRDIVDAYVDYVDAVTRRLGDRVADWITLNEPWCSAYLGYTTGGHAPGIQDPSLGLQATHHLLLAHGRAVPIIRRNSVGSRVGITLNLWPIDPATDSADDRAAAKADDAANNRLYLDPLFKGTYPAEVIQQFGQGRPTVRPGDMDVIGAPLDFLGVNYYMRHVVHADPSHPEGRATSIPAGADTTATAWEIYPQGLEDLLTRLQRDYAPPAMYVTENGAAFNDEESDGGVVRDERRRAYLESHFAAAKRAIDKGARLRGYFVWSLMDNFEWAEGYSKRFGIVYVDYATQERTVKDSGLWYADGIRAFALGS